MYFNALLHTLLPGLQCIWVMGLGMVEERKVLVTEERVSDGHGERSRSQLLFEEAGAGNILILAVSRLAVSKCYPHFA